MPPEEAVSAPPPQKKKKKKKKTFFTHYRILRAYIGKITHMITDYPHSNSAERNGGRGGIDRAMSVTRALNDRILNLLKSGSRDKTLCVPSQSQAKKLGNLGWVGGTYSWPQGCVAGVCAPHLPFLSCFHCKCYVV